MVEDSVLGSRYRTTVQQYLNKAYRHRIISAERPPAACDRCMPRDYTDSSTQLYPGCKTSPNVNHFNLLTPYLYSINLEIVPSLLNPSRVHVTSGK